MMAPNKTAALGWLGAQPGGATLAADMAGISDLQFKGLQLWLINLLPTWGSLVYNSWLNQGGGGLLTTRPVYDLLYGGSCSCMAVSGRQRGCQRQACTACTKTGPDCHHHHAGYEDPVLLAAAQGGDPQHFRLSPWLFTPGLSVAFPTKEWPLEYFTNGEYQQLVDPPPRAIEQPACCSSRRATRL